MYRVLVVDDDTVIRQDLKSIIDWDQYGYAVTAEADNGVAALELIRSTEFDLVITDIYMPFMDGVELIRKAKNEYPGMEFVVISNYDEFKYVKDAMKYGAFDYLLKYEIDAKNFAPIITSVRNVLDERRLVGGISAMETNDDWRRILEEKFWRNTLMNLTEPDAIRSEAGKAGIDVNSAPFILLLMDVSEAESGGHLSNEVLKELDKSLAVMFRDCSGTFKYAYMLKMEESLWIIILKPGEKSQSVVKNSSFLFSRELTRRVKQRFDLNIALAISEVVLKAEEFPDVYEKMRECLDYKFYFGLDTFIDMAYIGTLKKDFDENNLEHLRKGILEAAAHLNFEAARQYLASAVVEVKNRRLSPGLVYDYFTVMLISLKEVLSDKGIVLREERGTPEGKRIHFFKTLKSIEVYLGTLLTDAENAGLGTGKCPYRAEVRKALSFIKCNYMKNVTLENVSASAGVSRNYLCRLFKEETGVNFVEYLNNYRIEKAKELIADSNKSMKEISSLVGLDYAYFCKVFKSAVGKRPSELR